MRIPNNRKGFIKKDMVKAEFEAELKKIESFQKLVYFETKLSHSGITGYKVFENCYRGSNKNSLKNLIQNTDITKELDLLYRKDLNNRHLNATQSRKLKRYSNKLCYYSRVRTFSSKKTGNYKFKVSFLTLTAPDSASGEQILKAFEHFLDYLRRTANCVYVWKKELGEKNNHLHIHILINNFIPFYIVSWKWKKLLLAEGVTWPKNEKGEDTNSHYRIELPKSQRLVAHYIAKYMAKAYELPRKYGYISGHSEILEECKEQKFFEHDLPCEEIAALKKNFRTLSDQFLTHIFVDLRRIQAIAPTIHYYFMKQFLDFQERITLPQKFWFA